MNEDLCFQVQQFCYFHFHRPMLSGGVYKSLIYAIKLFENREQVKLLECRTTDSTGTIQEIAGHLLVKLLIRAHCEFSVPKGFYVIVKQLAGVVSVKIICSSRR